MSRNSSYFVYFYCKASNNTTNKLALERIMDDGTEAAVAAAIVTMAPKHLITKNQIDKNNSVMIIDSRLMYTHRVGYAITN